MNCVSGKHHTRSIPKILGQKYSQVNDAITEWKEIALSVSKKQWLPTYNF